MQPAAKHQAAFTNFTDRSSCDVALGTAVVYWLGFACMIDYPFQHLGVSLTRRILEDSEFYKLMLGLQNVPQTFKSLKLAQV